MFIVASPNEPTWFPIKYPSIIVAEDTAKRPKIDGITYLKNTLYVLSFNTFFSVYFLYNEKR